MGKVGDKGEVGGIKGAGGPGAEAEAEGLKEGLGVEMGVAKGAGGLGEIG